MVPHVVAIDPWERRHVLLSGAIVGRGNTCALPLRDPRVSEAHALVSLRQGAFRLLRLRQALRVADREVDAIDLKELGKDPVTVTFADDLHVRFVGDYVPPVRVHLAVDGLEARVFEGAPLSLVDAPVRWVPGSVAGAWITVWDEGGSPCVRVGSDEAVRVETDRTWMIGGRGFTVSVGPFLGDSDTLAAGPTPTVRYRLVDDAGQLVVTSSAGLRVPVSPLRARLLRLLQEAPGGNLSWMRLARQMYPDVDVETARNRLDNLIFQLRAQLAQAGLAPHDDPIQNAGGVWRLGASWRPTRD